MMNEWVYYQQHIIQCEEYDKAKENKYQMYYWCVLVVKKENEEQKKEEEKNGGNGKNKWASEMV